MAASRSAQWPRHHSWKVSRWMRSYKELSKDCPQFSTRGSFVSPGNSKDKDFTLLCSVTFFFLGELEMTRRLRWTEARQWRRGDQLLGQPIQWELNGEERLRGGGGESKWNGGFGIEQLSAQNQRWFLGGESRNWRERQWWSHEPFDATMMGQFLCSALWSGYLAEVDTAAFSTDPSFWRPPLHSLVAVQVGGNRVGGHHWTWRWWGSGRVRVEEGHM